jgi:DNA-binding protein YbaB
MAKGFKRPMGMGGGGGGMMDQIRKLQEQMEQTQAELAEMTTSATVGGGVIKVVATGDQKISRGRPCERRVWNAP